MSLYGIPDGKIKDYFIHLPQKYDIMKLPTAISAIISALAGIAAMHGQPAAECGTGPAGNCREISGNGPQYAVVGLSVNFLREAPDYTAELGTQALMGDIVEIVDRNGYWCKVVTEEPYTAWCTDLGLVPMEASELELKIARSGYIPSLSLSAGIGSSNANGSDFTFGEQIKQNWNNSVGITVSIPIFSNWSVRTNVRNAELSRRSLEIDLKLKQQTLYKDIQTAVTEADTYYRKMEAALANVNSMQESFRYVQEKFNTGALNGTDYTVARTNLLKARSEYLQAKYQFVFQIKIIDFYKGLPLTL